MSISLSSHPENANFMVMEGGGTADVIKDVKMESYLGLSRWTPGHHKSPYE